MKNTIIIAILFILFPAVLKAQKVFSTGAAYQADVKVYVVNEAYKADLLVYKVDAAYKAKDNKGLWFFTDEAYKADKKTFFTDEAYKADLKIFFVDEAYKAKWQKPKKKYLMY